MTMKYSPSTKGFYSRMIHRDIPSDAVDITEDEWKSLVRAQEDGDEIVENNGVISTRKPAPPAPPTPAEVDAEKERRLSVDPGVKVLVAMMFDMWNRLSKVDPANFPPMTKARFRTELKKRM